MKPYLITTSLTNALTLNWLVLHPWGGQSLRSPAGKRNSFPYAGVRHCSAESYAVLRSVLAKFRHGFVWSQARGARPGGGMCF